MFFLVEKTWVFHVRLIIIAFAVAFRNAGHWLVKENNAVRADAMVVLMGSIPNTVLQTADLYNQNVAGRVIIVGPGINEYKNLESRGVFLPSNSTQTRNALVALGLPSESIVILPGYKTQKHIN